MIRVLLVDDHASFRQALAYMLGREADLTVSGQAGSIAAARGLLADADVAVIDLSLPDGDGIELIRELRAVNPRALALVLTGVGERPRLAAAVEAGAAGLLDKAVGIDEVIDAVRRLWAGEVLLSPAQMVELLRLAGRQQAEDRLARAALDRLTAREWDVLRALADGLNDKDIAQRLGVSSETVRTHMVSILRKLDAESRLQALVFAVRHGAVAIA